MTSNPKTLVIRFSSIGDIVLSTPLLRVLRNHFPESQIDFVTKREYAELVRNNHNLNVTHEFDGSSGFAGLREFKNRLKHERYELVIDIHNNIRSHFLRSLPGGPEIVTVDKRILQRTALVKFKQNMYNGIVSVADRYIEPLKKYGIRNDDKGLELHIPDETLFRVSGEMARYKLNRFEKVIGLCPGARHFTKQWPIEQYAGLATVIAKRRNAKILVFGGKEDEGLAATIANAVRVAAGEEHVTSFAGSFSLMETAAAMQFCDTIVANDTGLMHIAAAMKKKVIAVFGSTVREFGFFPVGTESTVIERSELKCRPCSHIGLNACPEGHFRCMRETQIKDVVPVLEQYLE